MSPSTAVFVLALVGIYLGVGLVFVIAFQARGLAAIDEAAAIGSRGFRIAITPGVVALWPILLRRWRAVRAARS